MSRFPSSNPRLRRDEPSVDDPDPGSVDLRRPDDVAATVASDGRDPGAPVLPVAPPDATHDRRARELRRTLDELGSFDRCEALADEGSNVPASVVLDAVRSLHRWSADEMRDAMAGAEAEEPPSATIGRRLAPAEALVLAEAQALLSARVAAWSDVVPLLRAVAADPGVRTVLVERIGELVRPHRWVDTAALTSAVDAALDVALTGPSTPGIWAVEPSAASVARLVTGLVLQFFHAPDHGVARSMVTTGRPSGAPTAGSVGAGSIGPLARRDDGRLVSRPFRAGGVVVVGPPGVGKTALLKAVLAEFVGAVVVSTNKPWDLQDAVTTRLDAPVMWMDPSGSALIHHAVRPVRVDPVEGLTSLRHALAAAEVMVKAQNPAGSMARDRFFLDHAERLTGALLWWAKLTSRDAAGAARALGRLDRVARELRSSPSGDEAFDIVRTVGEITEVTRSGIIAQTAQVMKAWSIDRSGWERFERLDAEALIRSAGTLLLCSDVQGTGDDNVIVTAALDQMVSARFAMSQRGESAPPLLLLLDECANTAPHHLVPSWTSTGPGRGVNTVLLFQDVTNQMARVWGPGAAEIVNNAGTLVVYPGVTDVPLRQTLNGLAVGAELGRNPVDVVASATMPAPPPDPGSVYIVDEFGRVEVGAQIRFHEEVGLAWSAVEAALRHDPGIRRAVEAVIVDLEPSIDRDVGTPTPVSVIGPVSGRETP